MRAPAAAAVERNPPALKLRRASRGRRSWPFLPVVLDQLANFPEFLGRGSFRAQCAKDERFRRSAKGSVDEIFDELPLRLLFSDRGGVHVRARRLIAADEPFL